MIYKTFVLLNCENINDFEEKLINIHLDVHFIVIKYINKPLFSSNMNKLTTSIATLMLTALGSTPLKAQEPCDSSAKASTKYAFVDNSFTNKNMFFGMNFGNMPLDQSYLEAGNKHFQISVWTNYDIEKKHLIEIDFFASFKRQIELGKSGTLTLQPGVGYLTFPNQDPNLPQWSDFKEINFKATLTGLPVDASVRMGKAFGDGYDGNDFTDCFMADFDLSKTVKLFSDKLSITGNIETIYNSNYFSGAKGFSHVAFTPIITYSPFENVAITGSLTGQKKVNPEMDCVKNESYYKIGLTYSFK
jgi:hypothetical protein